MAPGERAELRTMLDSMRASHDDSGDETLDQIVDELAPVVERIANERAAQALELAGQRLPMVQRYLNLMAGQARRGMLT